MKDQLSALMDGEFEIESSEHLITSAKSGGELKEAWQHYHLIGDTMRGNAPLRHDFCMRVMQVLEAEPTMLASKKNEPSGQVTTTKFKLKNPKMWSIAASVAAVMFVGLMLVQQQFGQADNMAPVEIAQSLPLEYLEAHQSAAPSSAAYYIQNASFDSAEQQK